MKQWCVAHSKSEFVREIIEKVADSDPVRRIKSGKTNSIAKFPSRKMGFVLTAESRTLELPAIKKYEDDDDVSGFWEQPIELEIPYYSLDGRRQPDLHHFPDFLVVRKSGRVGFEEWKLESRLERLAEDSPGRYERDKDEHWHNKPVEEWCRENGFYYEIHTDRELSDVVLRNSDCLRYFYFHEHRVDPSIEDGVERLVTVDPGIILSSLIARVAGASMDDLLALIAAGKIYVNLEKHLLCQPEFTPVYIDESIAEALEVLHKDQRPAAIGQRSLIMFSPSSRFRFKGSISRFVEFGEDTVSIIKEDGTGLPIEMPRAAFDQLLDSGAIEAFSDDEPWSEALRRFKDASPEDRNEALRRYHLLQRWWAGATPEELGVCRRTLERWQSRFNLYKNSCGSGLVGLLPAVKSRGGSALRLPGLTEEERLANLALVNEVIQNEYETKNQPTRKAAWRIYKLRCKEQNLRPCSYSTFATHIDRRPRYEQELKRKGGRGAYPLKPPVSGRTELTHRADRPCERGHMDSTVLDIMVIHHLTGEVMGRPRLTWMIDDYSRRMMGRHISFEPNSEVSTMMVMQDAIKRRHRLPETIVTDSGREFDNRYLDMVAATFEITLERRPKGAGRGGAICERILRTINEMLIHNLPGNTKITKTPRNTNKENDPKRLARLTLWDLYRLVDEFLFDIYDNKIHPDTGTSPRNAWKIGFERTGQRAEKVILWNELVETLTLPTTDKGTVVVQPGKGVKVNNFWYESDALNNPLILGQDLPVRYFPYDLSKVRVFVGDHWETCTCDRLRDYGLLTIRDRDIISAEKLRETTIVGRPDVEADEKLAYLFEHLDPEREKVRKEQEEILRCLDIQQDSTKKSGSRQTANPKKPKFKPATDLDKSKIPTFEVAQ